MINNAANGDIPGPFSAKRGNEKTQKRIQTAAEMVVLSLPLAGEGMRLRLGWFQIFAARSANSLNKMPLLASICSISSVASPMVRPEVSSVSSAAFGGS